MTHYQTLGLDPTASPAEIALAYQDRAGRMTPEIQRAFQILSSPKLRDEYDHALKQPGRTQGYRPIRRMAHKDWKKWRTGELISSLAVLKPLAAIISMAILILTPAYLSGSMAFQLRDAGNEALLQGDLYTALQKHERAAAINHLDPGYRSDLARTYLALNRHADAITQYTQALEMDPEHPPSLTGRAQVWEAIGNKDMAEQDIQAAARLGITMEENK